MVLITHVIANVIFIYLGLIVFLHIKKNAVNIIFALIAFLNVLWSIANYFSVTLPPDRILFWIRLEIFFVIPYAVLFAVFMNNFPSEHLLLSKKSVILILAWTIFMMFLSMTPYVFEKLIIVNNIPLPVHGKLIIFLFATLSVAVFYGIFMGFKKYIYADVQYKNLWRYIIFGTVFSYLMMFLFLFIFVNIFKIITFVYFAPIFVLPMITGMAYSILKYQALGVKITLSEIFIFLIIGIVTLQLLTSKDNLSFFLNFASLIVSIILSGFLIDSILREIKQREKLEELNRLKSEFLSFASHQIKSPMTNIKGFIDLILDGIYGQINDKIREILIKVKNNINEEIDLVDNLLDLRKIEEGRVEYNFDKFDLFELIKEICDFYKIRALDKSLGLNCKINNESIFVNGDREKLKQVFDNLVDNAIKYTNSGFIEIDYEKSDSNVVIKVKDTGIGIKPDLLKNLFGQFIRDPSVKKTIKGTGLGLFIAKEIIKAHKGKIWAESEGEGKGSTFYVELPILKEDNKA
jgi:signal transduction histidine kinase